MRLALGGRMYTLVARAPKGQLLWTTHAEAGHLFGLLTRAFPELRAICLMPDHLHLILPHADPTNRLARVMSGYTRWRNHTRGEIGPAWVEHPVPEALSGPDHIRRSVRYIHLNPCRAALVRDPLAWAWSSHRDAVGLAIPGLACRAVHPKRFHAYVSADPSASVSGTPLPVAPTGPIAWNAVVAAISAVCRVPLSALTRRGPARTLAVQTAWFFGIRDVGSLAELTKLTRSAIHTLARKVPAPGALNDASALAICIRVAGDPRFGELHTGDLRLDPRWARYSS